MTDSANKITSNQSAIENIEIMPPVDILEDNEAFTMHFEVPGSNASSVKLEVENGILSLECASTLRRGKRPVLFKRIFRLSRAVDVNKITAKSADGVLTLVLPKAEHVKPIKIAVS